MSIEEQKIYYDKRWRETENINEWSVLRGKKILEYLNSLSLINPKILDLGCGNGWFTDILSKHGEATGVDLSEEAIEQAKRRYPNVRFFSGNIFDMSLPSKNYDVVISMEVIEHISNQEQYIQIILKCLKSKGYLILSTPNRFVMNRMDLSGWDLQPIENWLDMKSLKKLLMPDFKILASTTIIPTGSKGICRYINSVKINNILNYFISKSTLIKLKEKAGFGLNIVVLAQKAL